MENMTTVNDTTNDGNGFHAMIGSVEIGGGSGGGGSDASGWCAAGDGAGRRSAC